MEAISDSNPDPCPTHCNFVKGVSLHNCRLVPSQDLKSGTILGSHSLACASAHMPYVAHLDRKASRKKGRAFPPGSLSISLPTPLRQLTKFVRSDPRRSISTIYDGHPERARNHLSIYGRPASQNLGSLPFPLLIKWRWNTSRRTPSFIGSWNPTALQ
jgi:hypothetical protein